MDRKLGKDVDWDFENGVGPDNAERDTEKQKCQTVQETCCSERLKHLDLSLCEYRADNNKPQPQ